MIRVIHGDEPPALANQRERRLAKLQSAWNTLDRPDTNKPKAIASFLERHAGDLCAGYRQAWPALRRQWRHRCAYCSAELHDSDPIDHFRPRHPQPGEHSGYWWLTWSWRNLLPTCVSCNLAKSNTFPVEGERLQPLSHDTEAERPLLLDPSRDDPQVHLEFFREEINGRERWTVQGRKRRGKTTAAALRLDRDSERYAMHLERLRDLVHDLEVARERGPDTLRALWRRKIKLLLTVDDDPDVPGQPFPALSHAYLRHHFGEAISAHDLELPPLGDPRPTPPITPPYPERGAFADLDAALQLELRSLGRKPETTRTHALLHRLVAHRSWTLDELAELLPQSSATLARHLRTLTKAGTLSFDGQHARAVPKKVRRRG